MEFKGLKERINDRAKARKKKKREKERRKRRSLKYGQVELKHSRRGAVSCVLAFCAVFLTVLIFTVAYISRGEVNLLIGLAGLIALVLSAVGLANGIQGFKERNKNYITCKVGIGANGILLFIMAGTLIRGLL